jgi:hypothetical protein
MMATMTAASEAERASEALVEVARDDVDRAVAAGVIRADQAEALWRFMRAKAAAPKPAIRPRFDLVHLLWYAGALIVIGAMGLFTSLRPVSPSPLARRRRRTAKPS